MNLTPEQEAAARVIAENEAIIGRLQRQNQLLAGILPRARRTDPGVIINPITGERANYATKTVQKRPRKRPHAG